MIGVPDMVSVVMVVVSASGNMYIFVDRSTVVVWLFESWGRDIIVKVFLVLGYLAVRYPIYCELCVPVLDFHAL